MAELIALDSSLTQAIAGHYVNLMAMFTFLGEPILALPILVAAMHRLHNQGGTSQARTGGPLGALSALIKAVLSLSSLRQMRRLLVASLCLLVVVQGTKRVVDRPRPAAQVVSMRSLPGGHLRHHAFPSGHSAFAALVAGAIVFSTSALPLRLGVTAVAIIVGWSRIAIGAHWFGDVLVGLLLGFGLAFVALRGHRETVHSDPGDTAR
jgi:membrane-associated phospholipid phosphatase